MGIRYTNPPESERRLHEIDPHLSTRWNEQRNLLEIWYSPVGRAPYLIMRSENDDHSFRPIDGRAYDHLRWLLWFNRNIVQNIGDQIYEDERSDARREQNEYEENCYMGRQIWPAFEALNRITGNSYTAKRRPHIAGFRAGE